MITYTKQPHAREYRLIFKNVDREGWDPSIECYMRDGGYDDLRKAMAMPPKDIIEEVKKSGLRGRGGAGFPTGMKWTFIPPNNSKPVYLICNGDESEPGTFKDRYILHQDPHQLIEGMIISAFAVGAHTAYIYLREEFPEAALIVGVDWAEPQCATQRRVLQQPRARYGARREEEALHGALGASGGFAGRREHDERGALNRCGWQTLGTNCCEQRQGVRAGGRARQSVPEAQGRQGQEEKSHGSQEGEEAKEEGEEAEQVKNMFLASTAVLF
jgi:hypothetical protein